MYQRNKNCRPSLFWKTMDAQNLDFSDGFFDIIIDKSTIDCMVCCQNAEKLIENTMKECQRVLKPTGYLLSISLSDPSKRIPHI